MIWLLNQLELTAVAALTPQKLAYAINKGFPPHPLESGRFPEEGVQSWSA